MPTYDYECQKCGHRFEEFQSIKAEPLKTCPEEGCRGKVRRLIGGGGGLLFRGSGFYITDYRSEGYKKAAKADSKDSGSSSSSDRYSGRVPPLSPEGTSARLITPKVSRSWLYLSTCFRTSPGVDWRETSTTTRIPVWSDSSRRSVTPVMRPSRTSITDVKEQFREEIREELSQHASDWEERVADPDEARELLESIRPFQAHRTLRAFLEAYAIVADRLAVLGADSHSGGGDLIRDCLDWGKQYLRQRRIHSAESVSKTLLENGVRLAENRQLLDGEASDLSERRLRLAHELHDTIRRLDAIDALASARRAGALR